MMTGPALVKEICLLLFHLLEIRKWFSPQTNRQSNNQMRSMSAINLLVLALAAALRLALAGILPLSG
jgi:hypothetical protein